MQAAAEGASLGEARHSHSIPGPKYRTPLTFFLAARPEPLGYAFDMVRQYGEVVRVRTWGMPPIIVLSRPDHIRHVMQENNRNYVKGEVIAKMKALLGEGLFTSEGDFWRRQRKLAQPAFHRQRIQGFADIMVESTATTLSGWEERSRRGESIDVMSEMSALTLAIVGRALFGVDLSDQASDVGPAVLVAFEELTRRVLNPFSPPLALPTPGHCRLRRATRALDQMVCGIIAQRMRTPGEQSDLLAMLMEARDADTGEGMSPRQLRDEVMTFVLAGHETTAVALAWAVHLLSQNPEIERRLRAEVRTALGDRRPQLADLANLGLARRVIDETMRLYPPVPAIQRQSVGVDEIGGYEIPAKAFMLLLPYATHRDPTLWSEPERFDPDRFLPENAEGRHRYAYYPFGAGPRLCIGNEFALMESTLVLAMLVQRFDLEPDPAHQVTSELRITLRPKSGVWMRVKRAGEEERR